MPTPQELLVKLIKLRGPCPEICDGTIPLGGDSGTDTVNILNGLPVTSYPPVIKNPVPLSLTLIFDDISNAPVTDPSSLSDWNTFFDLPAYGNSFSSVTISGNSVQLFGGSNIKVKGGLMYNHPKNYNLLGILDYAGCITSVGGDAFSYCTNLTDVSLPECRIVYGYQDSPFTDVGGFAECPSLFNVNFPKLNFVGNNSFFHSFINNPITLYFPQLKTVDDNAFNTCTSIIEFNLPSLTGAGNSSFSYCNNLRTINLPSLINANTSCFYNCPYLEKVTLNNLISAGFNCFYYCSAVVEFILPSLRDVGDNCFYKCFSVTGFTLFSTINLGTTVGDNNVFGDITGNNITLTIPSVLMTCDGGNPDGDIVYLASNNTLIVNGVPYP